MYTKLQNRLPSHAEKEARCQSHEPSPNRKYIPVSDTSASELTALDLLRAKLILDKQGIRGRVKWNVITKGGCFVSSVVYLVFSLSRYAFHGEQLSRVVLNSAEENKGDAITFLL